MTASVVTYVCFFRSSSCFGLCDKCGPFTSVWQAAMLGKFWKPRVPLSGLLGSFAIPRTDLGILYSLHSNGCFLSERRVNRHPSLHGSRDSARLISNHCLYLTDTATVRIISSTFVTAPRRCCPTQEKCILQKHNSQSAIRNPQCTASKNLRCHYVD
ncbi:hypothetical protein DFH11DRAFT_713120 [Phellopilus nigrolimitatus]|nr:hypothetical protein DFH11DRAFT_713120 [Phellopilus nigrolimitatus]